jgi:1-acyl-sn-glycerol-3-phosphate acyltransferase
MSLSGYGLALLISLVFPKFRVVSDEILRRTIALLLSGLPWLKFDSEEFDRAYAAARLTGGAKTGILLVSNHRSHLDTFLLLSRVRGIRVLAKRSLFAVPLLGLVMWTSRQIPVRRKHLKSFVSAMDTIGRRLAAGEVVHVFPEMTRAAPGFPGVAPFNPAPIRAAMKAGVPILPLVIQGTGEVWPKGAFAIRSGAEVRLRPLALIPPSRFGDFSGAKELSDFIRKEIEGADRR